MDWAAGSDESSQVPLQVGCVAEEPCDTGNVCRCRGPLRTGLRCCRSRRGQMKSLNAGALFAGGSNVRNSGRGVSVNVSFSVELETQNKGSHSLKAFVTYIAGQTPFPEFSVVLMLDDLQIGYDSVTWKAVYRTNSDSKYYDEEQSDADTVFRDMYNIFKEREIYLKEIQNRTYGVYVHQRLVGCELLNYDKPGPLQRLDALDGQTIEEFTFDMENNSTATKMTWRPWDQQKWLRIKFMYENVYHPICIKVLRRYLNMEKNNVLRKVKPRVRLMKKTLTDSQELQISCLATGFYPRHINLTLFRDDQPVDDDQITGGEILPNGDVTYQMRKSLVISAEEQRERHKYNCTMKHLNLDNKLDIMFDVAEFDPGSFSLSVVISVLVLMCVAVLIITALIIWRKKRQAAERGSAASQIDYSPTPSSTHDKT
ncbi:DLA class I histocompatibility antigen, A9/A9 alpha chain-like [Chanodichthys erythropterus]|uniref:DLA class I histocompatibility antigen, A9/A9 alpha chain-like n=1 Tax=Chanodichthys erythropterus TaxID=933992 RepID=UPI00351DADEE